MSAASSRAGPWALGRGRAGPAPPPLAAAVGRRHAGPTWPGRAPPRRRPAGDGRFGRSGSRLRGADPAPEPPRPPVAWTQSAANAPETSSAAVAASVRPVRSTCSSSLARFVELSPFFGVLARVCAWVPSSNSSTSSSTSPFQVSRPSKHVGAIFRRSRFGESSFAVRRGMFENLSHLQLLTRPNL